MYSMDVQYLSEQGTDTMLQMGTREQSFNKVLFLLIH